MGVAHAVAPLAHCGVNRVLKRHCAGLDGVNLCAEQLHSVHVKSLADCVLLAHENLTFKSEQSRNRSGCNAVLTCAGLSDYPCLAHFFGKQALTEAVVELVRTGVV